MYDEGGEKEMVKMGSVLCYHDPFGSIFSVLLAYTRVRVLALMHLIAMHDTIAKAKGVKYCVAGIEKSPLLCPALIWRCPSGGLRQHPHSLQTTEIGECGSDSGYSGYTNVPTSRSLPKDTRWDTTHSRSSSSPGIPRAGASPRQTNQ